MQKKGNPKRRKKTDRCTKGTGAAIRGRQSEGRIMDSLEHLKRRKIIVDYERIKSNSKLDGCGIDVFIEAVRFDMKLVKIPLQIKSSFNGLKKHRRKYGRTIQCIVALKNKESIDSFLMGLLRRHQILVLEPSQRDVPFDL